MFLHLQVVEKVKMGRKKTSCIKKSHRSRKSFDNVNSKIPFDIEINYYFIKK